jgi:hypothetical protein
MTTNILKQKLPGRIHRPGSFFLPHLGEEPWFCSLAFQCLSYGRSDLMAVQYAEVEPMGQQVTYV